MTRYLLGEMSGEERAEFEEHFLNDSELFEELIALEDEMMRSCVRRSGPEVERTIFEKRFLRNPASRQRFYLARSLMNYVSSVQEPVQTIGNQPDITEETLASERQLRNADRRSSWFGLVSLTQQGQFVAAIVTVALIAGSSLLALRLNKVFSQMQAQHADDLREEQKMRSQLTELNSQVKQQKEQVAELSMGSVLPYKPPRRSVRHIEPEKPLVIPKGFSSIFLEFTVEGFHSSYSASLETPEGQKIWPPTDQINLKSWPIDGNSYGVGLLLPARILANGTYVLTLSGKTDKGSSEDVQSYAFRVIKN